MADELKIDDEFRSLIPPLGEEELAGLEADIQAQGCRDPIVLWAGHGIVLDGHNRLDICSRHGIEYATVEVDLEDRIDARLWIRRNQMHRRNLNAYQRCELAVGIEEDAKEKAKQRQIEAGKHGKEGGRGKKKEKTLRPKSDEGFSEPSPHDRRADTEAAKAAGVGKDTYRKAKKIREMGVDPETEEKLRRNQASVHRVYKDLKEQQERQEREEKRKTASEAIKEVDERIILGDFREQADRIPDGSASLIFTDPPYDRKASKMLPDLADFAEKKLADGGSLICYVGQTQLPDAIDALRNKLRYWWVVACVHEGGATVMREYGINAGWKAVLWFVKGTRHDNSVMVSDVMSGGEEKDAHEWQQSLDEAVYWIDKLCPEDGLVVDPFLGSGTTAVAAKSLRREWIGFEIDENTCGAANQRVTSAA